MGPSPRVARRRQATAVVLALAATGLIWALFLRGGTGHAGAGAGAADAAGPRVRAVESRLSTAEMIDQVLLLGFAGTSANGAIERELRAHELGGVIVGPDNWTGRAQGTRLVAGLRAAGLGGGRVSPLIAVEQEGGPYRALADLPPARTELAVGNRASPPLAERWAQEAAAALRGAGFDLDLFPDADVTTPTSPVGNRAFGASPELVAALTAAALRGCARARLACAPLFFPGLGAASQDTDQGPATVGLDPTTLADLDLPPFRAAFAERAPAVVLSLAYYAAYDPVTPGALTSSVATDLLRGGEVRFRGLAITDDLSAGAITATEPVPEATVEAIAAGADLVQIVDPRRQRGVRAALAQAVATGAIPRERLADAAARVLELKRRIGLLKGQPRS
jgi:beta-N-acetylhexosaminidase